MRGIRRSMASSARSARWRGPRPSSASTIEFLSPEGFPSFQLPTYPGLRLAIPSRRRIAERIEAAQARCDPSRDRRTDRLRGARLLPAQRPAVHDQLYDALSGIHLGALADSAKAGSTRRCDGFMPRATVTMVATPSLMSELGDRGFANLGMWTRGVDIDLFRPDRAIDLGFPRPIFMTVGRVAVEKNLRSVPVARSARHQSRHRRGSAGGEAQAQIPGRQIPRPSWRTARSPRIWRPPMYSCFRAAPTRSASCNSKRWRAAFRSPRFPVTGPKDVVGDNPIGVLNEDLARACMQALWISARRLPQVRAANSWENSARQFIGHVRKVATAALASSKGR